MKILENKEKEQSVNRLLLEGYVCRLPVSQQWMDQCLAVPEEQQDSYIDEEIEEQPNSCIYEETEEQAADCETEPDAKESSSEKEYKYMAESQCMWGTWVISDKMYGGKSGWRACDDEFQDKVFQFMPHCFWYDGEMTEISFYYATLLAVSDDYPYRGESFERLGVKGDYFLVLEFAQDICPFGFTLISDTEMLLYSGRMLYRAEKTDRDDIVCEENAPVIIGPNNSVCYGKWEIEKVLKADAKAESDSYVGEIIEIGNVRRDKDYDIFISRHNPETGTEEYKQQKFSYSKGTQDYFNSPILCEIVSVREEEAEDLLDVLDFGSNEYIVYCSFVTDFYWEKMIIRNDMTAVFVKGTELYLAKRISNPIDDDIYDAW